MKKKFLPELTYLNVWLCLIVILIHVISNSLYGTCAPFDKARVIFAPLFVTYKLSVYVVQGFVFLSAVKFFLKYKDKTLNYLTFLRQRVYKIVLPYVIWFAIYALYITRSTPYPASELFKAFWQCTLVAHFYFIAIIVQFYVLMPLWLRLFRSFSPVIMLPFTAILNLLALYMIPDLYYYYSGGQQFSLNAQLFTSYIFFWCAGAYVGLNYERVMDYITRHIPLLTVAAGIFGAGIGFYTYIISVKGHMMFFTEILYLLYQICIIFLLLAVFAAISKKAAPPKLVRLMSGSSYSIYLSHILFIMIAEDICSRLQIGSSFTVLAARCFAAYVVCIGACIAFGAVKKRLAAQLRRGAR